MEKKRSIGVTVCGIIMLFYGALSVFDIDCGPVPLLLVGLIAPIYIVCGGAILELKNWGRLLAIWVSVLTLLRFIVSIMSIIMPLINSPSFQDGPASFITGLFLGSFILRFPLLIFFLYFLTRPKVKEQFK